MGLLECPVLAIPAISRSVTSPAIRSPPRVCSTVILQGRVLVAKRAAASGKPFHNAPRVC
jgi:hypothetical protein